MPKYLVGPVQSKVGIQRDSTPYHSVSYVAGQWCRFYDQQARKIGGYKLIDLGLPIIIRSIYSVPDTSLLPTQGNYFYLGRYNSIVSIRFDYNGTAFSGEIDRTPVDTTYFDPGNVNNLWVFDQFTDSTIEDEIVSYVVAQVAPNAVNISNNTEGGLFYGSLLGSDVLQPVRDVISYGTHVPDNRYINCSGGIVFVSPVMVAYGNGGVIQWSAPGLINSWPNSYNLTISNSKIIKGANSRGGVLFWTLNTLVLATPTVTGEAPDFVYGFTSQVIEPQITVMSPSSICSFNQVFYWVGTDQFYSYSGVVTKIPNTMNTDWFFDNINLAQRAKVWSIVIGHYSEIWWFYPRNTRLPDGTTIVATECNAAVIYNVELNVWYDTSITRSAGVPVSTFPYPVMASSIVGRDGINFPVFMHEFGWDEIDTSTFPTSVYSIPSYFQTHLIDLFTHDTTGTNLIRNRRLAPDFVQTGPMNLQINYQDYPNEIPSIDGPYTFYPPPIVNTDPPATIYIDFATQGAIVSFTFSSDTINGFYQGGKTLFFYNIGDTLK